MAEKVETIHDHILRIRVEDQATQSFNSIKQSIRNQIEDLTEKMADVTQGMHPGMPPFVNVEPSAPAAEIIDTQRREGPKFDEPLGGGKTLSLPVFLVGIEADLLKTILGPLYVGKIKDVSEEDRVEVKRARTLGDVLKKILSPTPGAALSFGAMWGYAMAPVIDLLVNTLFPLFNPLQDFLVSLINVSLIPLVQRVLPPLQDLFLRLGVFVLPILERAAIKLTDWIVNLINLMVDWVDGGGLERLNSSLLKVVGGLLGAEKPLETWSEVIPFITKDLRDLNTQFKEFVSSLFGLKEPIKEWSELIPVIQKKWDEFMIKADPVIEKMGAIGKAFIDVLYSIFGGDVELTWKQQIVKFSLLFGTIVTAVAGLLTVFANLTTILGGLTTVLGGAGGLSLRALLLGVVTAFKTVFAFLSGPGGVALIGGVLIGRILDHLFKISPKIAEAYAKVVSPTLTYEDYKSVKRGHQAEVVREKLGTDRGREAWHAYKESGWRRSVLQQYLDEAAGRGGTAQVTGVEGVESPIPGASEEPGRSRVVRESTLEEKRGEEALVSMSSGMDEVNRTLLRGFDEMIYNLEQVKFQSGDTIVDQALAMGGANA